MTDDLSREDRSLLEAIQRVLPICERPFEALGLPIGLGEDAVIERLEGLKASGILRTICAVFDTRSLGYKSALAAVRVADENVEKAAAAISAHPGVSHNYQRPHAYNIWFTLATPPGSDFDEELKSLAVSAGALASISLPSLRVFRIGVRLDLSGNGKQAAARPVRSGPSATQEPLDAFDKAAVLAMQEDFLLVPEPYDAIAQRLDSSVPTLFSWINRMQEEGRLRRISGLLRHRRVGYQANGMTVWQIPEERVDAFGRFAADIEAISHCYERPTGPDWPYNMYTMIDGKRPEDCEAVVRQLEEAFEPFPHEILYSTREFKKERIRYFVEASAVESEVVQQP